MKMTVGELFTAMPSLEKLSAQTLPTRISYHIGRMLAQISREYKTASIERNKLIKKFAGDQDTNGNFKVLPEHADTYLEELETLANTEIEIHRNAISLAALEGTSLTPGDFMALGPLVVDLESVGDLNGVGDGSVDGSGEDSVSRAKNSTSGPTDGNNVTSLADRLADRQAQSAQ